MHKRASRRARCWLIREEEVRKTYSVLHRCVAAEPHHRCGWFRGAGLWALVSRPRAASRRRAHFVFAKGFGRLGNFNAIFSFVNIPQCSITLVLSN